MVRQPTKEVVMGPVLPTVSPKEQLFDLMGFVAFTNKFRAIERTIWFEGVQGKERNGEHSFQVALCAWYANHRFGLGLSAELLIRYALVHDLVETYAKETPAFPDPNARKRFPTRKSKERRERAALARIKKEWISFPELAQSIEAYEKQSDQESRFVCALEKLLATINIYQDNGRAFHKLNIALAPYHRYKSRRTKVHPLVRKLWVEMRKLLKEHEKTLFPA